MFQSLFDRLVAPCEILLDLFPALAFETFGKLQQPLRGVRPAVEEHIFDALQQIFRDLVVNFEHTRVDDSHVHPRKSGVIEEGGVHRLAHLVVAAERERNVRDAARHHRAGKILFDPTRRVDEIEGVVVVLLDPRGDG